MSHEKVSFMKLNNEELARITLDYQERFIDVLDDLKRDISHLKKDLSGLKSNSRPIYKSLETSILNYLKDSRQGKKDATLTYSIL